ncbi:MAG: diguanylate cyclase [Alphaproteobacteria bacterium]|nr:diguanylate cyclase [Alphaproteobacteria bacterium]MDP6517593.1 diguanylate cyclase [Alphaproteobacteria bacterium]
MNRRHGSPNGGNCKRTEIRFRARHRRCSDRLEQALIAAQRQNDRLALLLLDLDGFKNVNESLGHAAGDQLLKEMAVRINKRVRGSDTVARRDADEFTVLLPRGERLAQGERDI